MKKLVPIAVLLALVACSDDEGSGGTGTVSFTTYGEDYIEKEIPASDVEDGWRVTFTKFLLALGPVSVGESASGPPAATMPGAKLFDMHRAGDKPVFSASLPAKAYPHVSFAVAPATAAIELADGVPEADKQLMVSNGYSVYVEGSMAKGAATKSFKWGFETSTLYYGCKGELAGKETEGVVVTNGGTDAVELTIHGDHFFYDDLQSPDAKVRGDHLAEADTNGDGEITLEELAAVQLAALPKDKGTFGTGTASNVNDLRAFLEALSRTVGHFRGEGECFAKPR